MTDLALLPQPAFIKDNPVMQVAFRDFMYWAVRTPEIRAQFTTDTRLPWRTENIGAFTAWAIVQLWGAEDDPRVDGAA